MNKFKILALPLAIILANASCTNHKTNSSGKADSSDSINVSKSKKNIIRQHVPIAGEFTNIVSIGCINIDYTPSDKYDLELEGDSVLLSHVQTEIESSIFTINLKSDVNKVLNVYESNFNIIAHLQAPPLSCVSLIESGNFTCNSTWEATDIHLGCMSTGSFNVKDIRCETFKFESTDFDHSVFHNIAAQEAKLYCLNNCKDSFNVNVNELEIILDGKSEITVSGKAAHKTGTRSGKSKLIDKVTKF